jgi:hypothetical protein
MKEPIACIRCGRKAAFSEEGLADARVKGGKDEVPFPPPIPAGVCVRCAFKDPELQEPLRQWMKGAMSWGDQRIAEFLQRARDIAAWPLDAIDHFIDSLR